MLRISALALSFAFVLTPVLAVVCEAQCVGPAAAAASPGCHSAEPTHGTSVEHTAPVCMHDAGALSIAAASHREARQRLGDASMPVPALPLGAEGRLATSRDSANPPGVACAPLCSARHRILRV